LTFFDQSGNVIEDTDAGFYEEREGFRFRLLTSILCFLRCIFFNNIGETEEDLTVIYVEKQSARWSSSKFRIEVERLRNLHDIDVAEEPEEVFRRTIQKAKRERSRHPNWSKHTTAEKHPEWFKALSYTVSPYTTKDEILAKKEKIRRKGYLKKFERKSMKNFMISDMRMREKDMDQDTEIQDALDYLADFHDFLQEIETNHHSYSLLRTQPGPKFCDETGRLQCGATYANGAFTRAEITCQNIDLDIDNGCCYFLPFHSRDTGHSINFYATLIEHAFLQFFDWDHVMPRREIKHWLITEALDNKNRDISAEDVFEKLCTISNLIPYYKPCHVHKEKVTAATATDSTTR